MRKVSVSRTNFLYVTVLWGILIHFEQMTFQSQDPAILFILKYTVSVFKVIPHYIVQI